MFFYYKQTPSPIYTFVAQFYVCVPVILLTTLLSPLFATPKEDNPSGQNKNNHMFLRVMVLLVIISCMLFPVRKLRALDSGATIKYFSEFIIQNHNTQSMTAIDYATQDISPFMAGLLLELDRRHIDACTTWKQAASSYPKKELCQSTAIPVYSVVKAPECDNHCLIERDGLGLKSVD